MQRMNNEDPFQHGSTYLDVNCPYICFGLGVNSAYLLELIFLFQTNDRAYVHVFYPLLSIKRYGLYKTEQQ